MSSKTDKRANEILKILRLDGKTTIDELIKTFDTSPASVRRDLVRLEEKGLVHRMHGGVVLTNRAIYEPRRIYDSIHILVDRSTEEESRIAAAAASLVNDGETIGLNAGTTTTLVGCALRQRRDIRIITNAINIGMELSGSVGCSVHVTGGSLRRVRSFSLTGQTTIDYLEQVVTDRTFLAVCGVDADRGAMTIDLDEAAVLRVMALQSKRVIIVADSSKIGKTGAGIICSPSKIDLLITDEGISEQQCVAFKEGGVRVMRV